MRLYMNAEAIPGRSVALICFSQDPQDIKEEIASMKHTLHSLGYEVIKAEFKTRLRDFIDILQFNRPDIAVNLCRPHPSFPRIDIAITGVLDLLGIPYTGQDPLTLSLAHDTRRALGYLAANRVPLCPEGSTEDSRMDIALVGNGSPHVLSSANGDTTPEMVNISLRAYSLLGLRDYALFNFSTGGNCTPKLSGFSPNPELTPHSHFAQCAEASGLSYPVLIDEILTHALQRAGR